MLITTVDTVAGTTGTIMGQVQGPNGDLTAGSTTTVKLRVVDKNASGTLVVAELSITPSAVLAALSTSHPWNNFNDIGYNFRYEILGTEIPLEFKTYIFQFEFTFPSDQPIIATAKIITLPNLFQIT